MFIKNYFDAFSRKDLKAIESMFSADISLQDWNVLALGKDQVMQACAGIFNQVDTIIVTPVKIYSNSKTSYAARISIEIDKVQKIDVIDVIKFNDQMLICSIEAFLAEKSS